MRTHFRFTIKQQYSFGEIKKHIFNPYKSMHSIENVLLQMHNNLKLEDDVTYSSKDGWCILGYREIVNNNV